MPPSSLRRLFLPSTQALARKAAIRRHFSFARSIQKPHWDSSSSAVGFSTSTAPSSRTSSASRHLNAAGETAARVLALQRIRAWRQSQQAGTQFNRQDVPDVLAYSEEKGKERMPEVEEEEEGKSGFLEKIKAELSHPWPEWVELINMLLQKKYFDSDGDGHGLVGDWEAVRIAFQNFGYDRGDILKSLSKKDIKAVVGHGCPSTQKKVVYSAKLLRKLVHLNEGDVCSTCSLRSTCSRGFLLVPKEYLARTLDVMRVLLAFGYNPVNGLVENNSLVWIQSVEIAVMNLIRQIIKFSSVSKDPRFTQRVIEKTFDKVKKPVPLPRKRGCSHFLMKKGDWLCSECGFMNFGKNAICMQCDAKAPKRQLLPGEWECPKCDFLNYMRNLVCFQCNQKRPSDGIMEKHLHGEQGVVQVERAKHRFRGEASLSNALNSKSKVKKLDIADLTNLDCTNLLNAGGNSLFDGLSHGSMAGKPGGDGVDHARIPAICERDFHHHHHPSSNANWRDFDKNKDSFGHEVKIVDGYRTHSNSSKRCDVKDTSFDSDDSIWDSDSDINLLELPQWNRSQNKPIPSGSDDDSGSDDIVDRDFKIKWRKGTSSHFRQR